MQKSTSFSETKFEFANGPLQCEYKQITQSERKKKTKLKFECKLKNVRRSRSLNGTKT